MHLLPIVVIAGVLYYVIQLIPDDDHSRKPDPPSFRANRRG